MERFAGAAAFLRRRAEDIVVFLLASIFMAFLIQIVFRYFLNLPLGWTIEYVSMAWLWGILFGYAFVVNEQEIIRFDLLYNALSPALRRMATSLSSLIVAAVFLYALPRDVDFVAFMAREKTAFMHIPFDWLFSVYIGFSASVIVRALLGAWRAMKGETPDYTPDFSEPAQDSSHG